jgi:hypothetical protein
VRYRPFRYPLPLGSAFGSGKNSEQIIGHKSAKKVLISQEIRTFLSCVTNLDTRWK